MNRKPILVGMLAVLFLSGCASFDLKKKMDFDLSKRIPWTLGGEQPPGVPDKAVAIWSDTVLHSPGRSSVRGFGGRVLFYDNDQEKPIKVEGRVEVYAFDETNRPSGDEKPDRKYVFTTEQVEKHFSENELGPSYSFWLPWDPVGGEETEVSLIVRFMPSEGGVVVSEPTRHLLPGKKRREHVAQTPEIQQTSYTSTPPAGRTAGPVQSAPERKPRLQTTTIDLPPRFGRPVPNAISDSSSLRSTTTEGEVQQAGPASDLQSHFRERTRRLPGPPAAGFPRGRSRPLGRPIARLERDPQPRQPYPQGSPYAPQRGSQSLPASGWPTQTSHGGQPADPTPRW